MTEKLKGATRLASSSKTYGAGGVRRQRERDFGRVFTGLLFALFVATLLMAILAGTDVYRGLNREGDAADNQRLSLTPVSYTHLDVYKRQSLESGVSVTFNYKGDSGAGTAYVMPIENYDWLIMRTFPSSITDGLSLIHI